MDSSIEDFIAETEKELFEKFNTKLQYMMVQRKLVKILEKDTTALCEKITNGTIHPKKLIELLCSDKLEDFLSENESVSKSSSSTSSRNKSSEIKSKSISWTTTAPPKRKRKQPPNTFFNPLDLLTDSYKTTSGRLNTSDGVQIPIPIQMETEL